MPRGTRSTIKQRLSKRRPRGPGRFRKTEIARAIASAKHAGAKRAHLRLPDGIIMDVDLTETAPTNEPSANPWDEVLTNEPTSKVRS